MTDSPATTRSASEFVPVRGLRYHVRRWGDSGRPRLLLTHGWMDLAATFERVAQRLAADFEVLIPDWRGFGETEWPQDGYWFADYVADLDALVDHYSPDQPILLAGHSMGSQAVSLFAGLRPKRVSRLAILDGLFLPDGDPSRFVRAYRMWLKAQREVPSSPTYESFEFLAGRVRKNHPTLDAETALFVAQCWGRLCDDGLIRLRSDPKHLINMPRTYRQSESDAIWAEITAPTLFVDAGNSPLRDALGKDELERRRAQFQQHQTVELEGVGHMMHFEAPETLADTLRDFFQQGLPE